MGGCACVPGEYGEWDTCSRKTLTSDLSRTLAEQDIVETASVKEEQTVDLQSQTPVLKPSPGVPKQTDAETQDATPNIAPEGDPLLAARQAAYLERKNKLKESRDQKKKRSGSLKNDFLSNLPEVDADIPYRFNFIVIGPLCTDVIKAVCTSNIATSLPKAGADEWEDQSKSGENPGHALTDETRTLEQGKKLRLDPGHFGSEVSQKSTSSGASTTLRNTTARTLTARLKAHNTIRCLCPVPFPPEEEEDANSKPKLAKLSFTPYDIDDELKSCRNRFEALGTAIIFVFAVDVDDGEHGFDAQLACYERTVNELRTQRRPLRPTRHIIILRSKGCAEPTDQEQESWARKIEEFEQVDGPMWKTGPVRLNDTDAIYSAFASVASQRIRRSLKSDGHESDGSHVSEAPPIWEAERGTSSIAETSEESFALNDMGAPPAKNFRHSWLSPVHRGAA